MRHSIAPALILLFAVLACPNHSAKANEPDMSPAAQEMSVGGRSTPRALLSDQAVVPGYWQLGTSIAFASPTGVPDNTLLNVPTTTRLGIAGRFSLGSSIELAGGMALPPKQSEITDDPPLFGGYLMGRWALNRRQAVYLRTDTERLLQLGGPRDDGVWSEAAGGWDGRSFMDEGKLVSFAWNLGVAGGRAFAAGDGQAPWLTEAIAGIGLRFAFQGGGPGVGFAMGSDFRFPVLSGGDAYWAEDPIEINPQTRVDLHFSLFVTLSTGWDITATMAHRDRGKIDTPETILPVLAGGYDQQQLLFGFSYSGVRKTKPKRIMHMAAER